MVLWNYSLRLFLDNHTFLVSFLVTNKTLSKPIEDNPLDFLWILFAELFTLSKISLIPYVNSAD